MGIFISVLIKAFKKKDFFSLTALYFEDLFRLQTYFDISIRAALINDNIKTGKALALTVEGLSLLFRIARRSSCKFYTTIELAQALRHSTEI